MSRNMGRRSWMRTKISVSVLVFLALSYCLWAQEISIGARDPLRLGGNRIMITGLPSAQNPLWDVRMGTRAASGLLYGADVYDPDQGTVGPANFVATMPAWGRECQVIDFTVRARVAGIWYEKTMKMQLARHDAVCEGDEPPPDPEPDPGPDDPCDICSSHPQLCPPDCEEQPDPPVPDPPPPPEPPGEGIDIETALRAILLRLNAMELYEELLEGE
jgi:hypothetical protein